MKVLLHWRFSDADSNCWGETCWAQSCARGKVRISCFIPVYCASLKAVSTPLHVKWHAVQEQRACHLSTRKFCLWALTNRSSLKRPSSRCLLNVGVLFIPVKRKGWGKRKGGNRTTAICIWDYMEQYSAVKMYAHCSMQLTKLALTAVISHY